MSKKKKSSAKTQKNTDGKSLWKKGQSGNPAGRPAGSRNKASIAVENMFLDEQERLSRKCIKLAMRGNMQALKLCIERICPVRRDTPINVQLPRVKTVEDATKLTTALLEKVSTGELTPSYKDFLKKNNIHFIDVDHPMTDELRVPGDGHPNGKYHTLIAERISSVLDDQLQKNNSDLTPR